LDTSQLEETGMILDKVQQLACLNCSFASESIPTSTVVVKAPTIDQDDKAGFTWVLNKEYNIYQPYQSLPKTSLTLIRGEAFGEFGVSTPVNT
jgi:hypothetical protein